MSTIVDTARSPHRVCTAMPMESVTLDEAGFWGARLRQCATTTLPRLRQLMEDERIGGVLHNFEVKAGLKPGGFWGTNWQDEWLYKWIEAASCIYARTRDAGLKSTIDRYVALIAKAQDPDGYLATQVLRHGQRFAWPENHELYVMGHLLTAGCIHHRMTGERCLLEVAIRCADFLYGVFIEPPARLVHFCVNPSYIMGLAELYRSTGEVRYRDLAARFVDLRGALEGRLPEGGEQPLPPHPGAQSAVGSDLNQTRVPLRREEQVVGHAVFWSYLYAGATDVLMETGDQTLVAPLRRLWTDFTTTKMYINGGTAALHDGTSLRKDRVWEAVGRRHELPQGSAYNETCGQIGSFMWNWRMFLAFGEVEFLEVMERTLYNGIISGIGLDGASWFYTNPLRWNGEAHDLQDQDSHQRFDPGANHICCPSNLLRITAELPSYLYCLRGAGPLVAFFAASAFACELPGGGRFALRQETGYPWDGDVVLRIEESPGRPVPLSVRIPAWAAGATCRIGDEAPAPAAPGILTLGRRWHPGDTVRISLPMRIRLVAAHPHVESCLGQAAVMRGPLLYCVEGRDLPAGVAPDQLRIGSLAGAATCAAPGLPGLVALDIPARIEAAMAWDGRLYQDLPEELPAPSGRVTLIPYFAWANRGRTSMSVFLGRVPS